MFRGKYQGSIVSVFSSTGSSPLMLWSNAIKNGYIRKILDPDLITLALEIKGVNVSTTYIAIPRNLKETLGIRLPFIVIIAKYLNKYFTFEITVLDDQNVRRRFICSNFQPKTKIKVFFTMVPICLEDGWNKIQLNMAEFTKEAYGTLYSETCRIQINANTILRRVYFTDKLYDEEEMPREYRIKTINKKTKLIYKEEQTPTTQALTPDIFPPPLSSPHAATKSIVAEAKIDIEEPATEAEAKIDVEEPATEAEKVLTAVEEKAKTEGGIIKSQKEEPPTAKNEEDEEAPVVEKQEAIIIEDEKAPIAESEEASPA